MHPKIRLPWLAALAVACALPAAAQPAKARPDPADPQASAPPLSHRSALADYRKAAADAPATAWRDANDAVERIGGWRAYAREAAASAPAASAPAPSAAPAPVGPRR